MLKRIITAIIGVAILIPFVIFSDTWAFIVFTSVMAGLAVFEIAGCMGQRKNLPAFILAEAVCLWTEISVRLFDKVVFLRRRSSRRSRSTSPSGLPQ